MLLFMYVLFGGSLLTLVLLFTLKAIEVKREVVYAPIMRTTLDGKARSIKAHLIQTQLQMQKVPPMVAVVSAYFIHQIAIGFAKVAHAAGSYAHRFADFVSHKHRFVARPPQSEFLIQVSELKTKSESGIELTTLEQTSENVHNG